MTPPIARTPKTISGGAFKMNAKPKAVATTPRKITGKSGSAQTRADGHTYLREKTSDSQPSARKRAPKDADSVDLMTVAKHQSHRAEQSTGRSHQPFGRFAEEPHLRVDKASMTLRRRATSKFSAANATSAPAEPGPRSV